ncbi:serine/threonine-protein kinase [Erythrobacter cryptus]|uniref:serine/threonine-protein kinase n=1 Tax=Erythrobacter cryptus TaxID=196588 RepID=UPI0003FF910E|nr:serine/threonine-protein kinase [Erythrobacter cryptus]
MKSHEWRVLESIVDAAMGLPADRRAAFLEQQLAGDPAGLDKARTILARLAEAEDFLEPPPPAPDPAAPAGSALPGQIGVWQLGEELGRGGMGVVYAVARAEGGFEQAGALKLMRSDGAIDLRRFEAERQLLARLDHPGIARLLDGGVTAAGQPWMVMERVDGVPIERWCAARAASLMQRIALVLEVAEAVGAAHAMLVLHRDLKPGNVLVDAAGRVRVIDFGIAKELGASDQTQDLLPLSAPYAAPELLTGAPVGPPVDVYGLAAILYELASGRPPIDLAGLPVALGIGRVLDAEPVRLLALRDEVPVLAAAPKALVADLDAVLAKALRKQAADRYPTIEAFAEDLRRACDGRAVAARSGDRAYRLRRLAWRARWPIAATLAIVAALGAGLVSTEIQRREALAARDAALAEEQRSDAVRQSLYLLLGESVEAAGTESSAREVLDQATRRILAEFARDPGESARVLHALGELHFYLGDYAAAKAALAPLVRARARQVPGDVLAAARYDMAQAMVRLGEIEGARPLLQQAQAYWQADAPKWRARLIDSRLVEAQILRASDPAAAARMLAAATRDHAAMFGTTNRQAGVFQNNLGVALLAAGDPAGASAALKKAQAIWQATGLTDTPDALNTANNLAALEMLAGRPAAAEPLFAEAVRIRRTLFGDSAGTAALLSNHGKVLLQLGRAREAAPLLAEAAGMAEQFAGAGAMQHVAALAGLAEARLALGAPDALALAREALGAAELGKAPPPAKAMALLALAKVQLAGGDRAGARQSLGAFDSLLPQLGPAGARLGEAAKPLRAQL